MAGENFRAALDRTGLTAEQFAEIVEVDPKTVQRWLAGRTPYKRHRAVVARALDTPAHELWPEEVPAPPPPSQPNATQPDDTEEVIRSWGGGNDPGEPDARPMFRDARYHVDILDAGGNILATPSIFAALGYAARNGCRIRVLMNPSHPRPVPPDNSDIELRIRDAPVAHAVVRADDQMILYIVLAGDDVHPVLQIKRRRQHGLFDRITTHFDAIWDDADPAKDSDQDNGRSSQRRQPGTNHLGSAHDAGRRWPTRPD